MRVPADEFRVHPLDHVVDREPFFFFGEPGVEHNLKKQVPQFVFEGVKVPRVDRVHHLVNFLEEQTLHGVVILGAVPRTPLRAAQMGHQFNQLAKVFAGQGGSHIPRLRSERETATG
jgi:hypothetical protein